jgi:serine/threonine-protein kinase
MEMVEGPTLADRIKQGAIPLEQVLPIARQIADALEAAHEKGIVHRDLKPANIKVKPDGVVKVLDFGLAKVAQASAGEDPEASPTLTMQGTVVGQILGTAAYMAPEQARGKTVDKRADIWAFGVVLYEMLTGRRLFEGETISDTLAVVLTKEPDWERVPAKAQRLLRTCLEKEPKQRLRDIADAWPLLDDATVPAAKSAARWKIAAGALTLACRVSLGALAFRTVGRSRAAVRGAPGSRSRSWRVARLGRRRADGHSVAGREKDGICFRGSGRNAPALHAPAGPTQGERIGEDRGCVRTFFSPDGQWVGFYALGKLKKTRIDGGEPVSLCDAPDGRGASWGEDGNIVANLQPQSVLSLVPSGGGIATPISELGVGEGTHRWPQVLPGGNAVLFSVNNTVSTNFEESAIAALSLKDHRKKMVLEHVGYCPRYLSSGRLVYVSKGTLFAARFDLDRLEVRGAATALQEVSSDNSRAFAQFDVSPGGILAFRTGGGMTGRGSLDWLDGGGKTEPFRTEAANYSKFVAGWHEGRISHKSAGERRSLHLRLAARHRDALDQRPYHRLSSVEP